jgi:hypothetical protein
MTFREWLKNIEETMTSTGDIANFARPIGGSVGRMYPKPVILSDDKKKKKNVKKENL